MGRSNTDDSDYAPFDDDYRGFEGREDEAARGPLILAIAIGVLLIFGGVIWNTYRQGVRPEGEGLPSVLSEKDESWRRVPDTPAAEAVPHTDKRFFDEMDATTRDPLPPAAEEPVMELAGADAAVTAAEEAGGPTDLRRGPAEPLVELGAASAEPPAQPVESVEPAGPTPLGQPQGPRALFAFTAGGKYLVQIAALKSEEGAETAWKRVTSSAPELYHGASKVIQRADLGADGVIYRLRVGAFADRSEASAFCEAIKEAGANCIVVNG